MHVFHIDVSSKRNHFSHKFSSVFSNSIIDRSLSILILIIQVATFLDQQSNHLKMILSSSIIDCSLLQCVFVRRIDPFLNEEFSHFYASFLVFDMSAEKDRCLFESLKEDVFWRNLIPFKF